jgi:hypothetical protein
VEKQIDDHFFAAVLDKQPINGSEGSNAKRTRTRTAAAHARQIHHRPRRPERTQEGPGYQTTQAQPHHLDWSDQVRKEWDPRKGGGLPTF